MNWYKDNKLLGFAFFFLFDPCCELSYQSLRLKCKFTFLGNGFEFQLNLQFDSWCPCGIFISSGNGSLDPGLWLTYYPKTAIKGNNINNHPSGWTTLRAFFDSDHSYCCKKDESRVKPRKCGIHLVYKQQAFLRDGGDNGGSAEEIIGNDNIIKRSSDDAGLIPAEKLRHKKKIKTTSH